jgi:lipopolysaccharide cholinephosphotransferase
MELLTSRDIQVGSLEVLKKIDEVCKQLNLRYYLAYGTLIGAIRHSGFIPWDDDIDIMMPRYDYDKLVNYFIENKDELRPYEIINPMVNNKCPYTISRISDSRYKLIVDNEEDYGIGLFVDIYPLDGAGNSEKEYKRLKNISSMLASLCFLSTRKSVKRENTKSNIKYLIKFPAFVLSKIIGKNFLMKKLYNMASKCDYDNSKYIGCIIWASDDGLRGIFPKCWFDEIIDVEFESYYFKAPKDYDLVLKHGYGDYMKLPDEKDRIGHHYYDAYRV